MSQPLRMEEQVVALGRSSRRAAILSIVGLLCVLAAIGYAMFQLYQLQSDVDSLRLQREQLSRRVDDARRVLNAINPVLEKYGVLEDLTVDNLNATLVQQSFAANQEIQNIMAEAFAGRKVAVAYYSKDANIDPTKLLASLEEMGFSVTPRNPLRPDMPSNLVAFGMNVEPSDAKLVAFTLIRAGIQLKAICRSPARSRASVIQVLGDERLTGRPPLRVENVKTRREYLTCPANDRRVPFPSGV